MQKWRVKKLTWNGERDNNGIKILSWKIICIVETKEEAKRICKAVKADGWDNGYILFVRFLTNINREV